MEISSHIPKLKRQPARQPNESVKQKESYDVWTKEESIPAPKELPPPATLSYSKSVPALPPSTIRSSRRLLRPHDVAKAVTIAEGGQSYNPTLEDWEDLINRTAVEEQNRLFKQAQKEWVPQPEEVETPAAGNESEEDEEERSESFLGKPVQVRRKTRAQHNKEARQAEQVVLQRVNLISRTGYENSLTV